MRFLDMQPLFDSLRDRRVAIVGNATSLHTKQRGREIDAHDTVIRCNRGFMAEAKAAIGVRMDIWAVGAKMSPDVLDAIEPLRPVVALWVRPPDGQPAKQFEENARGRWPEVVLYDQTLREALQVDLGGARPTTGMRVIHALLKRSAAKEIAVYGFDFFATPTFSTNPKAAEVFHEPDREKALFESWLGTEPRLRWMRD